MSDSPPKKPNKLVRGREGADKSGASRTSLREVRIRWSRIIPEKKTHSLKQERTVQRRRIRRESSNARKKERRKRGSENETQPRAVRAPQRANISARERHHSALSHSLPRFDGDETKARTD